MTDTPPVRYAVSLPEPERHLAELEMAVELEAGAHILVMPVWTPGSYKVRDFSRNIRGGLRVKDSAGRALEARKVRKNAWQVEVPEATTLTVGYTVYGFEFTVRTNHIDDVHAFLNSTNTFLYVEGRRDDPCEVRATLPVGWQGTCPLPLLPDATTERPGWRASSYHELSDSPLLLGLLVRHRYEVRGIPHEVAVHGAGFRPPEAWLEPFEKICEAEIELFGDCPSPSYVFQVSLVNDRGGGLEHKNGSVIQFGHDRLRKRKDWVRFLSLIAHEYFHLWNGKRIRPEPFDPFDFDQEVYTRSLWVVEGITSYYDEYLLLRAELISPKEYLELLSDHIKSLRRNPGRFHDSLEEASYDAWIKLYQRDENTVNASTSYYLKGQLVAALLDLTLRARSVNQVSLDDVLRRLWGEFKDSQGGGYKERRIEAICAELLGLDLSSFFEPYVRGTAELDWNAALNPVGLTLQETAKGKPDLGATLVSGERVIIESVLDGGAGAAAGLSARDEVLAVNGRKVTGATFTDRLEDFRPGEVVTLHLFRGDELRQLEVTLGDRVEYAIVPLAEASPSQQAGFESWMRCKWAPKL